MAAPRRPTTLRRAAWLANCNALLWAIGAGLAPTLLITYLAMTHGAHGLAVSWVLAAPRMAGVLRLLVPGWIRRCNSRRMVCVVSFTASALTLGVLAAISLSPAAEPRLATLVGLWTAYQVLEYFGATALWSWLGDLYPPRIRGRLIGVREKWLTRGIVLGMVLGFAISSAPPLLAGSGRSTALAAAALAGACLMLASVAPLAAMNDERTLTARPAASAKPARAALWSPDLVRLLAWSMLLSVANGIAAAARGLFPYRVLEMPYSTLLAMTVSMRVGQSFAAPMVGRRIDRHGPKPILIGAQLVVMVSPVFFLLASPQAPWWIVGAYLCWIAYAGLNVGLDAMKLQVAPPGDNAPTLAVYYAANDVACAVTILVGGLLLQPLLAGDPSQEAAYRPVLLLGLTLRAVVAMAALALPASPTRRRRPPL